jgi:hypothetical protein
MTGEAVGLVAPELDGRGSSDSYIAAVAVETFACGTYAVGLIIADNELIDGEGSGGAVIGSPILIKAFLVPISSGEARVSLSELIIGDVGIDTLFGEYLHVLLGVEAGIRGQFGFLEHSGVPDGSEILPCAFYHGLKECQVFLKLDKSAIFCASSLVPHKQGLIFFYAVEIGKEISLFSIPTATVTT